MLTGVKSPLWSEGVVIFRNTFFHLRTLQPQFQMKMAKDLLLVWKKRPAFCITSWIMVSLLQKKPVNLPADCCPAGSARRLRYIFLLAAYGCPGKITTVISKDPQFWRRSKTELIRGVRKAQSGWEFLHTPCCTPHAPQACLLEHIHFTKWRYKQTVITSGLLKRWAAAIKLLV